ncbi:MAG: hypothetical protein ACI9Y7_000719 [Dokdonia sp.]|jgi:hypothetical protein
MKKHITIFVSVFLLIIITVITLSSFASPDDEIVGVWVSEEDPNWSIEFTNTGLCYWYYSGEDIDTFTYTTSETSPQCGYEVRTGVVEDYYLRLVDEDEDTRCYEILGINDETLSFSAIGLQVKNYYFLKQ